VSVARAASSVPEAACCTRWSVSLDLDIANELWSATFSPSSDRKAPPRLEFDVTGAVYVGLALDLEQAFARQGKGDLWGNGEEAGYSECSSDHSCDLIPSLPSSSASMQRSTTRRRRGCGTVEAEFGHRRSCFSLLLRTFRLLRFDGEPFSAQVTRSVILG
jgi:hypothetical protein